MNKLLKLSISFGLFIFVLALATSTYAISDNASERAMEKQELKQMTNTEGKNKNVGGIESKNKMMAANDKASAAATRKANKLSEARLKICEAREKNIENRFRTLLTLGVNTHKGKEKIVERVDKFYTTVLVPAGYILPNYDVLKADIETKEAAVQTILDEAQASGESFSCDSEDPKAQADEFKSNIQALINANKAYKTSVRTFVVAVRDLAKKAKADKISPSPIVSEPITPIPTTAVSPEVTETP